MIASSCHNYLIPVEIEININFSSCTLYGKTIAYIYIIMIIITCVANSLFISFKKGKLK